MASLTRKRLFLLRENKISGDLQLRFIKRLVRFLDNGYPLIEALEAMKWDQSMVNTATMLIGHLKNGKTLDVALTELNFNEAITNHLYFININGDLINGLRKSAIHFENRLKHTKKFQQMSRYPIILSFIFGVLLYFIKRTVLPSFIELFQSSKEAAKTINISIFLIDFFSYTLFTFLIITICFILIWQLYKKRISIERKLAFYRNIPVFRTYLKMQTSFLFASHLSTLLKTGMSMKEILIHLNSQSKLPIISYYTSLMTDELQKGRFYIHTMSQFYFFEPSLKSIFQKNEDSTALEKDLVAYSEMLVEEMERKIIKFLTLIQPIFFIILACFIIFIYVTLMWPMFQLIESI